MTDSQYLRDTVGPLLARGVAKVIEVQPNDPIEYLGLWLLHQTQLREVQQRRDKKRIQYEEEKKYYELREAKIKNEAATKIQTLVRAYQKKMYDKKLKQEEEDRILLQEEEEMKEKMRLEMEQLNSNMDEDNDKPEEVVKAERALITCNGEFKLAKELIMKLDADKIEQMKRMQKPPAIIPKLLKCVLLILDVQPKLLKNWELIRKQIKSSKNLVKDILNYDPTRVQKKRKFVAIGKILRAKAMVPDNIKKASTAAYLLYKWLVSAIELREASVLERKSKNEEDVQDEEEDEEEDSGDFDQPDELESLEEEEDSQEQSTSD